MVLRSCCQFVHLGFIGWHHLVHLSCSLPPMCKKSSLNKEQEGSTRNEVFPTSDLLFLLSFTTLPPPSTYLYLLLLLLLLLCLPVLLSSSAAASCPSPKICQPSNL